MKLLERPKRKTYVTAVDASRKRGKGGPKTISKTIIDATPQQVMDALVKALSANRDAGAPDSTPSL